MNIQTDLDEADETPDRLTTKLAKALKKVQAVVQEMLNDPDGFEEVVNTQLQLFGKQLPIEQAVNVFWPLLGDCDTFTAADKMKALELAEILGPDYVSKLRRMGKFMAESIDA